MIPITYNFDFSQNEPLRPYVLDDLARNGVENIVLNDFHISKIMNRSNYADVFKKEAGDAGLKFMDAHAIFGGWNDLNTPESWKRKMMLQRNLMTLEICAEMGVETITIHVGSETSYDPSLRSLDQNIARVKDALSQLLPTAEKLGITICIENIWFPLSAADSLLAIKKDFATENLGFCYDSGHANLCAKGYLHEGDKSCHRAAWNKIVGKDPEWDDQICEKMLPYIVTCHLHDNNGGTDQHQLPGNGNIDWEKICSLLQSAPRLKCIQSEVNVIGNQIRVADLCKKFKELFPG